MVCSSCLIALAGFGEDTTPASPAQTLPTAVGAEVLGSLMYVVGGPVVGAIALSIVGAVAWKSHRVAGGALGLVGGGILGGLVGSYFAARKMEAVLPQLQDALDAAAENSIPVTQEGMFAPPPGGWTIGPLELPAGTVAAPGLIPGNVSVRPGQLLGLLSMAKPPPANSAGPLKMNMGIPAKQPPPPAATGWKVPVIKASSPVVKVPVLRTASSYAASAVKVPVLRTASSYNAPAASQPAVVSTKKASSYNAPTSSVVSTRTASSYNAPPAAVACEQQCSDKYLPNNDLMNWGGCVLGCNPSAPAPAVTCKQQCSQTYGQQMLTGDSSGWYKCWVGCEAATSPQATAAVSTRTASSYNAPRTGTASTSPLARIGAAIQTLLAPKTAIPSSSAVNLIMPGTQAPTSGQPVVKPVLQISSTARQVVVPTAAVNTPSYGTTKLL